MTENLPTTPAAGLPALGRSPLIKGEDAAAYDDLVARIRGMLRPEDVIEEIWARDVADLAWEVFRLRRLKASLMQACAHQGVEEVLEPCCRPGPMMSGTRRRSSRTRRRTIRISPSAGPPATRRRSPRSTACWRRPG